MPLGDPRPEWNLTFEFSEWLDQQGLMKVSEDDVRSHENLVDEFFDHRETMIDEEE